MVSAQDSGLGEEPLEWRGEEGLGAGGRYKAVLK